MRWSPDGTYEIKLVSEFIGTTEYFYFEITSGERTVLIPCGTDQREVAGNFAAQGLAHQIGEFISGLDAPQTP